MSRASRDKGRRGEAEVAAILRDAGLAVRGLEASGDHVVASSGAGRVRLHSEVKRQETARPWAWWAQAEAETEPGSLTVVSFRRNRSPWLAIVRLDALALLVQAAGESLGSDRWLLELDRLSS